MKKTSYIFIKAAAIFTAAVMCLASCNSYQENSVNQGTVNSSGDGVVILSRAQTEEISNIVLECAENIQTSFNSPSEIPAYLMAQFLYGRMAKDGSSDSFERVEDKVKVPVESIREYAKKYFNIEDLTIDFASREFFDGQYMIIPNPQFASTAAQTNKSYEENSPEKPDEESEEDEKIEYTPVSYTHLINLSRRFNKEISVRRG